ncbi:hypothetical protein ACS0TY_023302 [Phlomoides rotata]
MNINEEGVNLGTEGGSKNYSTPGAGVNAESRLDRAFAASDPLSELVWSSHNGLSLKCANTRASDKKPFLVWNVGPSNKAWGSRDETVVDDDDMFVDKAALLAPLGRRLLSHGGCDDNLQLQRVPNGKGSAAGAVNKKEATERESRMCLYKAKGKESEDDIHESVRSCNSSGLLSRGIKRRGYVKDVMFGSKRIKNLIPLCSGSTSVPRHESSFFSWMSNMVRGDDSAPFPLPLACSIDVNAQNLHGNSIDAQDSASLNMGFQTIFQSLYCKDMDILNTGEEKENEFIEESRQLMVDDKMTLDDLCLPKQIILCDREVNPILVSDQNTSVAMSSVFARRLDAFRHIMPPGNNVVINDNQKVPSLYDIGSAQKTVALSEMFHAIRNLRLSRADILRWMNSDMSLSRLNGFFLRLRLRKLDQGLEGTSYYVACISAGDARDSIGCSSNKSILVDVGGIRSCITSQYISNHDFQEDEIKAWWRRALDGGCSVPSIDELNSKFNNRTSLGF